MGFEPRHNPHDRIAGRKALKFDWLFELRSGLGKTPAFPDEDNPADQHAGGPIRRRFKIDEDFREGNLDGFITCASFQDWQGQ